MLLFPLVAAFPLLYFADSPSIRLPGTGRLGDISYGLYLYGWPDAQVVCALSGDTPSWWSIWLWSTAATVPVALLSWHLVRLASTVSTVPIAWASWHFVEKPALALKGLSLGRVARRAPPVAAD